MHVQLSKKLRELWLKKPTIRPLFYRLRPCTMTCITTIK